LASKKPCLCIGGAVGGSVGRIVADKAGGTYQFDCTVPEFSSNGDETGTVGCIATGGTIIVIDK